MALFPVQHRRDSFLLEDGTASMGSCMRGILSQEKNRSVQSEITALAADGAAGRPRGLNRTGPIAHGLAGAMGRGTIESSKYYMHWGKWAGSPEPAAAGRLRRAGPLSLLRGVI